MSDEYEYRIPVLLTRLELDVLRGAMVEVSDFTGECASEEFAKGMMERESEHAVMVERKSEGALQPLYRDHDHFHDVYCRATNKLVQAIVDCAAIESFRRLKEARKRK